MDTLTKEEYYILAWAILIGVGFIIALILFFKEVFKNHDNQEK